MPSPLELLASNSLLKIKSLTARFEFRHHAVPPVLKKEAVRDLNFGTGSAYRYLLCLVSNLRSENASGIRKII